MDEISNLHDSILIHIVSSLDMKDAVRTGILSKRWKNLWTRVYNFVYACHQHNLHTFVNFVDNTLMRCDSNTIRTFSLSGFDTFSCHSEHKTALEKIDKWVEYVSSKKVEIMNLNTEGLQLYYHSGYVFQCSSLTGLELSYMRMKRLSRPMNWPLLKSLSLTHVHIEDTPLRIILQGCPVLDTLIINQCIWDYRVRVFSSSLKQLKLVDVMSGNKTEHDLEIKAPLLRELEIRGVFCGEDRRVIVDAPSLLKSSLDFVVDPAGYNHKWCYFVNELVQCLCQVGQLLIGSRLLQVVYKRDATLLCKHLEINSPLWKYDIPGIVSLLERMPYLETLVINVSMLEDYSQIDHVLERIYMKDLSSIFICGKFKHLKKVTIDYHMNPALNGECAADYEIVGYILRSCVALEKLVICSTESYCCKANWDKCLESSCAFRYLPQFCSKALMELLHTTTKEDTQWTLVNEGHTFEYSFSNYTSSVDFDHPYFDEFEESVSWDELYPV